MDPQEGQQIWVSGVGFRGPTKERVGRRDGAVKAGGLSPFNKRKTGGCISLTATQVCLCCGARGAGLKGNVERIARGAGAPSRCMQRQAIRV